MDKPKRVENIDLSFLEQCVEEYMKAVDTGEGDIDDLEHYIFEAAVESYYGPKVFDWINDKLE